MVPMYLHAYFEPLPRMNADMILTESNKSNIDLQWNLIIAFQDTNILFADIFGFQNPNNEEWWQLFFYAMFSPQADHKYQFNKSIYRYIAIFC